MSSVANYTFLFLGETELSIDAKASDFSIKINPVYGFLL